MIENETADLSAELESLRRALPSLAESLSTCIESLPEQTVSEIENLVDRLRTYAGRLDALVSRVRPWMSTATKTIDGIGTAIELRDRIGAARAVVERVLRIRRVGNVEDVRTANWYEDGVRLGESLDGNEFDAPPIAALADGLHPLAALADLVDRPDDFDDREWQFRYDAIRDGYGTEVAVAVARGRYEAIASLPKADTSAGAPAAESHHPTTW